MWAKMQRCATIVRVLIALFGVYLLLKFVTTDTESAYIPQAKKYFPTIVDINKLTGIQNSETNNNLINTSEDITNCTSKQPKLSNTSLPVTALVSCDGSGNTWTRHLLQQLTGLATASVYCDKVLRDQGFPYECHAKRYETIVVKTHKPFIIDDQNDHFDRAILLIRDPFETFISNFNHRKGHLGNANLTEFQKPGVYQKHVVKSLLKWVDIYTTWSTKFTGPVYVLQYEKLKAKMSEKLKGLAEFLHVNVTTRDIMCTVKLQEGQFHRKSLFNETGKQAFMKSLYSQDMVDDIKSKIISVQDILEKKINNTMSIDLLQGSTMS